MSDKVKLPCPAGRGCSFTTIELIYDQANEQLQSHISIAHPTTTGSSAFASQQQAERVKRPTIQMTGNTIDNSDYEHFEMLFKRYKERLGHDEGSNAAALLFECLSPEVSKILYDTCGDSLKNLTEVDLFSQIRLCCVSKKTRQASVMELFRTKQEAGQNIQSFLASLKAKARQCGFNKQVSCIKKDCSTQINVTFDTEIINDLFLAGLKDTELQQDLMAEENLDLDKAVRRPYCSIT